VLAGNARHSAIADFCFNLGTTRYKASTLKRRVDAGDWPGAAEELAKWVWGGGQKLPGLVARRAAESLLLTTNA
jgi:lysozyme